LKESEKNTFTLLTLTEKKIKNNLHVLNIRVKHLP
jgi:hypothetical protein